MLLTLLAGSVEAHPARFAVTHRMQYCAVSSMRMLLMLGLLLALCLSWLFVLPRLRSCWPESSPLVKLRCLLTLLYGLPVLPCLFYLSVWRGLPFDWIVLAPPVLFPCLPLLLYLPFQLLVPRPPACSFVLLELLLRLSAWMLAALGSKLAGGPARCLLALQSLGLPRCRLLRCPPPFW